MKRGTSNMMEKKIGTVESQGKKYPLTNIMNAMIKYGTITFKTILLAKFTPSTVQVYAHFLKN